MKENRPIIRRQHKDRLFCDLFSDRKNALSLYNAVRGTDHQDIDALEVVTLSDAIYMTMKNDLALYFHDEINLYEQQSSQNPNMPLRGFLYFARVYEAWLLKEKRELKLYGSSLVKIPAPGYYVLYNGVEKLPEKMEYRLSSAFQKPSEGYEWTAYMININAGNSPEVLNRCPCLKGYAELIALIREMQSEGAGIEEAVTEAIKRCIDRGILRDYLLKQRAEVEDMILTDFDQDAYEEMIREESHTEGEKEGIHKTLRATELLRSGKTVKEIAAETGLSEEVIEALRSLQK